MTFSCIFLFIYNGAKVIFVAAHILFFNVLVNSNIYGFIQKLHSISEQYINVVTAIQF